MVWLVHLATAQATGAGIASGQKETKTIMLGLHIYMGDIAFQQICISVCLAMVIQFRLQVPRQAQSQQRARALALVYVQYAVMLLITTRIVFRLIEYSAGTVPNHEAYQYVFDSVPMMIAGILAERLLAKRRDFQVERLERH
ncbi:uncharacterized protein MYCFIDRAFT_195472 [Pseudocercospora fijiensis CIRAD86]|uniref:Uncharacterized protein n=1 Tax=Pseudocercospora fijiensis (strain CIRAD86) TaxID=383855 RepID=M3B4W8_PSEFD|nr:uncharacterized protein MYCFIDRAFT_195472 [Pseudocercospora fijiensis CIRAD86]EME84418.1 hypothetical protein MYCFIDRAFT_195472 [Pseudocercospora fijiensis CIRAD86]